MLLAITGEGYDYQDIEYYADFLRRELVLVEGVGKVIASGEQEEVIVEVSRSKLSNGYSNQPDCQLTDHTKYRGRCRTRHVDEERFRIATTGEFESVEELANLVISNPGASNASTYDVAQIYRDTKETDHIVRFNGQPPLVGRIVC